MSSSEPAQYPCSVSNDCGYYARELACSNGEFPCCVGGNCACSRMCPMPCIPGGGLCSILVTNNSQAKVYVFFQSKDPTMPVPSPQDPNYTYAALVAAGNTGADQWSAYTFVPAQKTTPGGNSTLNVYYSPEWSNSAQSPPNLILLAFTSNAPDSTYDAAWSWPSGISKLGANSTIQFQADASSVQAGGLYINDANSTFLVENVNISSGLVAQFNNAASFDPLGGTPSDRNSLVSSPVVALSGETTSEPIVVTPQSIAVYAETVDPTTIAANAAPSAYWKLTLDKGVKTYNGTVSISKTASTGAFTILFNPSAGISAKAVNFNTKPPASCSSSSECEPDAFCVSQGMLTCCDIATSTCACKAGSSCAPTPAPAPTPSSTPTPTWAYILIGACVLLLVGFFIFLASR
jgi:hypothetical protein